MIKRLQQTYQKHATLLKFAFIFSVLIFVVRILTKEARQIDWGKVSDTLTDLPVSGVFLLVILGIVAVSPMLIYDYSITKLLPGKYRANYVIRSGWIVNSLTNLAGAGGFLGASLRAYFYKEHASTKQIIAAISKIALFLVAGLSLNCWVALAVLLWVPNAMFFEHYWMWLVGGGLYFPLLFIITKLKQTKFFADLTAIRQFELILGSGLEWTAAAGFFLLIGYTLGIRNEFCIIYMLYVIASVIGVVSMLPGGLGSFDVLMLLELVKLGVPKSTAVAWLLLFRLFYYLIPFVIGILLLIFEAGGQINERLYGIPKLAFQKITHGLIVLLLILLGGLLLLQATLPMFSFSGRLATLLSPFSVFFLNQAFNIVFAFALLGAARGFAAKQHSAYIPTILVLIVVLLNAIFFVQTPGTAMIVAIALVLVVCCRRELVRQNMRYSPAKVLRDWAAYGGIFLLYIIVGVVNSPNYMRKHTVPSFMLFPAQNVWLMGVIGMMLAFGVLVLFAHHYTRNYDPFVAAVFDEKRVAAVIDEFGGTTASHLAFVRDKQLFFYQENGKDKLFFMYKPSGDKLVIMGEPVGDKNCWRPALEELMYQADLYGYTPVFYEVNERFTLFLHEFGFDFLKSGEEGYVNLADFTIKGRKMRGPRALMNKCEREGYTFEMLQPPFDEATFAQLRAVSDEWLNGESEKAFSLGYFDEYYLNQAPIAVVKDKSGKIIAFANLMPQGSGKKLLSIDLMRYSNDAPSGIMDKIFVDLFNYGKEHGYQEFNLGMAPLANVGRSNHAFFEERIERLIFEYGTKMYGFAGLRSYKEKYVSYWIPKYTAYHKHSSLALTMLQVTMLVNAKVDAKVGLFERVWLWMSPNK